MLPYRACCAAWVLHAARYSGRHGAMVEVTDELGEEPMEAGKLGKPSTSSHDRLLEPTKHVRYILIYIYMIIYVNSGCSGNAAVFKLDFPT